MFSIRLGKGTGLYLCEGTPLFSWPYPHFTPLRGVSIAGSFGPALFSFSEMLRDEESRGISRRLEISRVIAAFLRPFQNAFARKKHIYQ